MLLQVTNVNAGYHKETDILKGVSIEIEKQEIVCLIGPNGAGKSTLLKLIYGLLKARSGFVRFRDEEIGHLSPDEILKKGISFVPQGRTVFKDMTVEENLEMGGCTLERPEKVHAAIQNVYELFSVLGQKKNANASTLSSGEQQMLEMGRALILNPALLLLDEPSLGLAPKVCTRVFDTIKTLREAGTTILMVEQRVREGLKISDRAYVLSLGQVKFAGPAAEALESEEIQKVYLGH
jgi:branched-chain amino acid transport system ATP-binding protein